VRTKKGYYAPKKPDEAAPAAGHSMGTPWSILQ
jgi:hypothetical protein